MKLLNLMQMHNLSLWVQLFSLKTFFDLEKNKRKNRGRGEIFFFFFLLKLLFPLISMIQRCQSRFAFSRLGWYTTAIKALIPDKELAAITTRSIRPFANLTSTIVKTELEDVATTSTTIPVSLSRNIPQIVQPSVVPVVSVQRVSATPENVEYHRCAGFKKSDGRRCNRLVRVESVSASADQAYHYCHDHLPHPIADKDRRDNRGGKHTEAESLPFAEKKKPANVPVTEKDRLATPVKVPGSQKIYDCWDCKIQKLPLMK
ncbi:hypothetical protein BDF20DRAFT_660208 [Mycotypha africana]|uniref:uncharacterized protein n=1 Tax=Mycotypha africana TaxID=64632 RepID=UPI0023014CD4|nr:uncharacterized protein BDF20DRAFT_660208 [Mycotypha africana]KAI8973581.1 hypothetical protein BDF20DRAFT_660208 [Mycotypha africana]